LLSVKVLINRLKYARPNVRRGGPALPAPPAPSGGFAAELVNSDGSVMEEDVDGTWEGCCWEDEEMAALLLGSGIPETGEFCEVA